MGPDGASCCAQSERGQKRSKEVKIKLTPPCRFLGPSIQFWYPNCGRDGYTEGCRDVGTIDPAIYLLPFIFSNKRSSER
jgi:hypothetical protein